MAKFTITETIHSEKVSTVRLGTDTVANAGHYTDKEVGKAVKLTAESRFAMCAAGDKIEAIVSTVNLGVYDGFSIGGVVCTGYKEVTFDGLQGTPGVGAVVLNDFVVAGTVSAAGTALPAAVKVCKATTQTNTGFAWRVVSLGSAGTGAVGTTGVIERV